MPFLALPSKILSCRGTQTARLLVGPSKLWCMAGGDESDEGARQASAAAAAGPEPTSNRLPSSCCSSCSPGPSPCFPASPAGPAFHWPASSKGAGQLIPVFKIQAVFCFFLWGLRWRTGLSHCQAAREHARSSSAAPCSFAENWDIDVVVQQSRTGPPGHRPGSSLAVVSSNMLTQSTDSNAEDDVLSLMCLLPDQESWQGFQRVA